jgi:hypothetical protein
MSRPTTHAPAKSAAAKPHDARDEGEQEIARGERDKRHGGRRPSGSDERPSGDGDVDGHDHHPEPAEDEDEPRPRENEEVEREQQEKSVTTIRMVDLPSCMALHAKAVASVPHRETISHPYP